MTGSKKIPNQFKATPPRSDDAGARGRPHLSSKLNNRRPQTQQPCGVQFQHLDYQC
jgi:hypothetical protein